MTDTGVALLVLAFSYLASQKAFSQPFRLLFLFSSFIIGFAAVVTGNVPSLGWVYIINMVFLVFGVLLTALSVFAGIGKGG